jgi:hypothetical protein
MVVIKGVDLGRNIPVSSTDNLVSGIDLSQNVPYSSTPYSRTDNPVSGIDLSPNIRYSSTPYSRTDNQVNEMDLGQKTLSVLNKFVHSLVGKVPIEDRITSNPGCIKGNFLFGHINIMAELTNSNSSIR